MRSNVFESANARDIESEQLAREFIWTQTFDRLFSKRNHIILGARGTGKTAFAKMLTMEGLINHDGDTAKKIISSKSIVATYLPLKAEFTTKLSALNKNEAIEEMFFIWSLNLASCNQFIKTCKSIINVYCRSPVDKAKTEQKISQLLSKIWIDTSYSNLKQIEKELSSIEYAKNLIFNRVSFGFDLTENDFSVGQKFHNDLFTPLKRAIGEVKSVVHFDSRTIWALCVDEAEILSEKQWELLNTQLRTASDLSLKITTMPYKHKTLRTRVNENLIPKHDFEYIYLDRLGTHGKSQKESDKIITNFASDLFDKKVESSHLRGSGIKLQSLLGKSDLTDSSENYMTPSQVVSLIDKFCNDKTKRRAIELFERNPNGKFDDEIARKIKPLLVLRDFYDSTVGQGYSAPKIYSGSDVAIKCCDGNPRKLINLFNRFISALPASSGFKPLPKGEQGRILRSFSVSELDSIRAEDFGYKASELLTTLGNYFKSKLHNTKIGTTEITGFDYDSQGPEIWESIKVAVDLGLLLPSVNSLGDNDGMPIRSGTFQFAGCLCPYFHLVPRKGRSVKLGSILREIDGSAMRTVPNDTKKDQMELFDE